MQITRKFNVAAIHGEANREKLNADKKALNQISKTEHARARVAAPAHLDTEPDEQPQVLVVLRDDNHHDRIELHLTTWEEVEEMKKLAGYDRNKHHWKTGGTVSITVGK